MWRLFFRSLQAQVFIGSFEYVSFISSAQLLMFVTKEDQQTIEYYLHSKIQKQDRSVSNHRTKTFDSYNSASKNKRYRSYSFIFNIRVKTEKCDIIHKLEVKNDKEMQQSSPNGGTPFQTRKCQKRSLKRLKMQKALQRQSLSCFLKDNQSKWLVVKPVTKQEQPFNFLKSQISRIKEGVLKLKRRQQQEQSQIKMSRYQKNFERYQERICQKAKINLFDVMNEKKQNKLKNRLAQSNRTTLKNEDIKNRIINNKLFTDSKCIPIRQHKPKNNNQDIKSLIRIESYNKWNKMITKNKTRNNILTVLKTQPSYSDQDRSRSYIKSRYNGLSLIKQKPKIFFGIQDKNFSGWEQNIDFHEKQLCF